MIDRSVFFDAVRARPFGGKLTTGQVDGMSVLLDVWERDYAGQRLAIFAYCLATAKHETANTMQPIKERGGAAYLANNYDVTGRDPVRARKRGNTAAGDGIKYAGRGFVQCTWKNNYRTMGDLLGVDLVNSPDRAMEPVLAAKIMFEGLLRGLFTGAKITAFINAGATDFVGARKTVNGTDKAQAIADHAVDFLGALKAAEKPDRPAVTRPPAPSPAPVTPPSVPDLPPPLFPPSNTKPGGLFAVIAGIIAAIFRRA